MNLESIIDEMTRRHIDKVLSIPDAEYMLEVLKEIKSRDTLSAWPEVTEIMEEEEEEEIDAYGQEYLGW